MGGAISVLDPCYSEDICISTERYNNVDVEREVIDLPKGMFDRIKIDKGDLNVVISMLRRSGYRGYDVGEQALILVKMRESDESGRVYKLEVPYNLDVVSRQISMIESLPPSVAQLHGLECLHLPGTKYLFKLPTAIGDLTNLKELHLGGSGIDSLPSSIGRLQKLRDLDLHFTKNLRTLPREVGSLIGLIKLNLWGSNITSLPPSIGRMESLEELRLDNTEKLWKLPREIGDLARLRELTLDRSKIRSIPSSIGKLPNLRVLSLRFTSNLSKLPHDVRNLESLRTEDLDPSDTAAGRMAARYLPLHSLTRERTVRRNSNHHVMLVVLIVIDFLSEKLLSIVFLLKQLLRGVGNNRRTEPKILHTKELSQVRRTSQLDASDDSERGRVAHTEEDDPEDPQDIQDAREDANSSSVDDLIQDTERRIQNISIGEEEESVPRKGSWRRHKRVTQHDRDAVDPEDTIEKEFRGSRTTTGKRVCHAFRTIPQHSKKRRIFFKNAYVKYGKN